MAWRESNTARRHVRGVPEHVSELFEAARLIHEGRTLRALAIRCGRCRKTESTKVNAFSVGAGLPSVEQENRIATRRFEQKGWIVGTTASRHRCPECQPKHEETLMRATPASLKDSKEHLNGGASPLAVEAAVTTPPPKPMGFEDRRIIFEKLNEIYINEKVGYADDWTDKKVAEHLGVPQAWVAQIRADNFGPHGSNKTIDDTVAKATAAIKESRETATKLMLAADDLERRLIDIQKSVRP
jgi:hypothetical protein